MFPACHMSIRPTKCRKIIDGMRKLRVYLRYFRKTYIAPYGYQICSLSCWRMFPRYWHMALPTFQLHRWSMGRGTKVGRSNAFNKCDDPKNEFVLQPQCILLFFLETRNYCELGQVNKGRWKTVLLHIFFDIQIIKEKIHIIFFNWIPCIQIDLV